MDPSRSCPECGAEWQPGTTCQDHFHQMLFWEAEQPELGEVHHLMVLCYHLQHPSLYSPEGLSFGIQLLSDFLDGGKTPQDVRQGQRSRVDSGRRTWKIKASPNAQGSYRHPVAWPVTCADVVAGGAGHYVEGVRAWARSVLDTIKTSGNFSAF